jgi:hypothetical protein
VGIGLSDDLVLARRFTGTLSPLRGDAGPAVSVPRQNPSISSKPLTLEMVAVQPGARILVLDPFQEANRR